MKIHSMTATFGKLEHVTISFHDGLNVVTAKNEWGKSTWCAFLLAMLYGLDTRTKSTKTALAPKERFQPWSGSPMAGRMELSWQGREITLERTTKGRLPMGEFRAYETETGIALPELTAENCGEKLLGVEREVFCRAGFLRQEEMPVTQNDALQARLNALVTTGDDSGDAARLAQSLKELKNKCRYNKSGLLPQAQQRKQDLEERLRKLSQAEEAAAQLTRQENQAQQYLAALRNHRAALEREKAEADARQVARARQEAARAAQELAAQEALCAQLPTRQEAAQRLRDLAAHMNAWNEAGTARGSFPGEPEEPETVEAFRGLTGEEALQRAEADGQAYRAIVGKGFWLCVILALLTAAGGAGLLIFAKQLIPALILFGVAALLLGVSLLVGGREKERQKALAAPYGGGVPEQWMAKARAYADALRLHEQERQDWEHSRLELEQQFQGLRDQREFLCEGRSPQEMADLCRQVQQSFDRLDDLRARNQLAREHLKQIESMAFQAPMAQRDELNLTAQQTAQALKETEERLASIRLQLGGEQGALEALGSRKTLEEALQAENARVAQLERYCDALTLAQETLEETTKRLQRRFAPQISTAAQEFSKALTGDRYDRLLLTERFELLTGGAGEDTMRSALWRSDGTVDQLYLALRLAVAQVLTPEAPLILDDALTRFDDERMGRALGVLEELGEKKQVILFTCQEREERWLGARL